MDLFQYAVSPFLRERAQVPLGRVRITAIAAAHFSFQDRMASGTGTTAMPLPAESSAVKFTVALPPPCHYTFDYETTTP
jgi:hypothetical protein